MLSSPLKGSGDSEPSVNMAAADNSSKAPKTAEVMVSLLNNHKTDQSGSTGEESHSPVDSVRVATTKAKKRTGGHKSLATKALSAPL